MARRKVVQRAATTPARKASPGPTARLEPRDFSKRLWIYVAGVLALPALVLWHNRDALYSPPWYADAWFYLGYFRNLGEFKRHLFPGFYYGSRLSWILPGFLVQSWFPTVAANWILHLAVQSTATLSLFFILRRLGGMRSAFLATLSFSVYPWLWTATGWDYVDGAGIAYCLLALACFTRAAAHPIRRWSLLAAGFALAGMVYTHLFLATLAVLPLLYFAGLVWAWHGRDAIRPAVISCGWTAAGFGIVTAGLCGVNYLLDGTVWFYAPSFAQARVMAQNFQYIRPVWDHGELVPWLWPGAMGCLTAAALLAVRAKRAETARDKAGLVLGGQLLAAAGYMLLMQARGETVLGHHPYASYLLPFVFLVTGISFWPAAEAMSSRMYVLIGCAAGAIFALLWYQPGNELLVAPTLRRSAVVASAGFLAGAWLLRERSAGSWLALCGFAGFTAVAIHQTVYFGGVNLHGNRRQYERIMQTRERIEAVRRGRTPRFWFDRQEPNFFEYFALNATYLAEFSRLGNNFPRDCDVPVSPDSLVVVTSERAGVAELARSALTACWQSLGIHPVVESVQPVSSDRPFTMAMLHVEPGASPPSPAEELLQAIPLDMVQVAHPKASLERWPEGLRVNTLPDAGAFAARVGLPLDRSVKARLAVHLRVRVLEGKIGLGILDPSGRQFLIERPVWPWPQMTELILPLPSPPVTGDLIVRNLNKGASAVLIEKIEIRKAP